MASFSKKEKLVEFSDLKMMLAQSKITDNALYQTLQILIDRLDQLEGQKSGILGEIDNSLRNITNNIDLIGPHAPTHEVGGNDLVDIKRLGGYPGDTNNFLRADGTFAPVGGAGGGMNLDYLGNYTGGPVYNDGDIVIGADGIAYMCVVDGTVTPPEPWPGIGVGVNVALDATYWLAHGHSSLVNARVMNGRGDGYVRSVTGEPSVVATIPLTDTTGILPDNRLTSNVALKNIDNLFVPQTFSSYSAIRGQNSLLTFYDTGGPVNARVWRMLTYLNGNMYLEALNDDQSQLVTQFTFGRDGNLSASGFAGGGPLLTNLNASQLTHGLANPARLGNGTANSGTYLRGDSTWAPVPTGESFPPGLIVISAGPCPPGWTRVNWDGLFVRSGPVYGVQGGISYHSHGFNLSVPGHGHGYGVTTLSGDHTHPYSGTASGQTGGGQGGTSGADHGGSFTAPYADHIHYFDVNYSGTTGGGGNHSHEVTVQDAGAMGVGGNIDFADHMPPFIDVLFCQKN